MTKRAELRDAGRRIRAELGLDNSATGDLIPGWNELQDEMLFGRIWSRPALSREERMLATLAALTSKHYLPQLAAYVGAALHIGMSVQTVAEIMLHCAIYSGQPTAENSLRVVGEVCREKGLPGPNYTLAECDLDAMFDMGDATMRSIYAESAQRGYSDPGSAASELYDTAIQYLYGEVWNRPGLSVRQRMICSIACFTATQLTPQQRKWFPSAQKNVGLSRTEILEVISQTAHYLGFPTALNALVVAEEVLAAEEA